MYSSEDLAPFSISTMKACVQIIKRRKCLKRIFFQNLTEAMPKDITIEQFCSQYKEPYNNSTNGTKKCVRRMQ